MSSLRNLWRLDRHRHHHRFLCGLLLAGSHCLSAAENLGPVFGSCVLAPDSIFVVSNAK
jgi:hypothetical protein